MGQVNFGKWIMENFCLQSFRYISFQLHFTCLWFLEKGIDGHEIDLPNKKVLVTSKTLQKGEVEEIIKKTGLETTFVGEKDA